MITIFYDLDINKIDIKTAFLYNFINQLIYVEIFKDIKIKAKKNMIYKLLNTLYNLN